MPKIKKAIPKKETEGPLKEMFPSKEHVAPLKEVFPSKEAVPIKKYNHGSFHDKRKNK